MKIKAFAFALLASLFVLVSCGDDDSFNPNTVPDAAKTVFAEKYPGVSATWENENGMYKAEFVSSDGYEAEAWFSPKGEWIMTDFDFTGTLPAAVTDYITKTYPGYTVDKNDMLWVETFSGNHFELELEKKNSPDVYLKIKEDGTPLK